MFEAAGISWDNPQSVSALLSEKDVVFGRRGRKAKVLWSCSVMAVVWVIWWERNRRIFKDFKGDNVECSWDNVRFWASLWSSVSPAFRYLSVSLILLDWKAAVG